MSNTVWLCNYDSYYVTSVYGIEASFPNAVNAVHYFKLKQNKKFKKITEEELQEYKSIHKKSLNLQNDWHAGQHIDDLPIKVYAENKKELPKSSDVFFKIVNGYLLFNKTCYDIINQFNLGKSHFSQVYIYDMETEEQLSDTPYYFINIAETHNFLNSMESQGIRGSMYEPESPDRFISEPKDNDIILNNEANECDVDLWHDPILLNSLFLSDKLVNALLESGITKKDLGLVSCKVK